MIGFEGVDSTPQDMTKQLSQEDAEDFQVRACLRAIPAERRDELLALLRAASLPTKDAL